MRIVDVEKLRKLQKKSESIRNICILAHVDHGKTTLADSLVASNGIISNKLAGKLRYMDSRPDEQVRGITMKSSSITLHHSQDNKEYLLNIIDSPGHVDFASEVSTAVRLSDGALIIVDVVEGVCPQTRSALSMIYLEGLKPILILNKIDRLITEIKLTPLDAYIHLTQVLEQVNAVMGEIFASDIMEREDKKSETPTVSSNTNHDCQSILDTFDDSNIYFSPDQGNVLFASAVDGWGFSINDFSKIISKKLKCNLKILEKTLWGDYYLNLKTNRIMKGAQEKAKKPLFVSLILDTLWTLYDTIVIRKNPEKLNNILEKINIKLTARDLRLTDVKAQLQAVASQWLPLAKACINMICDKVPPPNKLSDEKVIRLISGNKVFKSFPLETQQLKDAFTSCNPSSDSPIIAFVSKMFVVEKNALPEFKTKPLTQEELAKRREIARQRHQQNINKQVNGKNNEDAVELKVENGQQMNDDNSFNNNCKSNNDNDDDDNDDDNKNKKTVLIGFARVYSGTLKEGCELYVLGPKHNPLTITECNKNNKPIEVATSLKELNNGWHITKVKIKKLYFLMGRELESVDNVPAGNVVGIGGLEDHVLKTATLSTNMYCPPFTELTSLTVPILRVALEPKYPNDLKKLINGLKLLNQADSCAVMHIQETGEIVLNTAGEIHLERCLEDLKLKYAQVDINVSKPIVPFRETIILPPTVDMVNETISIDKDVKDDKDNILEFWTANRQFYFEIDAIPLPDNIIKILEDNSDLIKEIEKNSHIEEFIDQQQSTIENNFELLSLKSSVKSDDNLIINKKQKIIESFKNDLSNALKQENIKYSIEQIWSFGPRKCGPNILINDSDHKRSPFWETQTQLSDDFLSLYDNSIINGFQLATLSGPLCEEPMRGVCFIIKSLKLIQGGSSQSENSGQGNLSGQVMSTMKEGCRRALKMRRPRLVIPMYSCSVLVNSDVLGKLYAVFGRRHGRVIAADSALGFGGQFRVNAILPVPESFNLARELRTETSGLASPQLVFSHWEIIEQDPFWVPSTEEEYLHFGEKADNINRAKQYIDAVRKRKGLSVDSQLVTHGEKQRTLSKKK